MTPGQDISMNNIMKKIIIMTALAAALVSATSCNEQKNPPAEGSRIGFAISFFKNVNALAPKGENVIVSPYSAGAALSMLEAGAEGKTKIELDKALNGTLFKAEDLSADGAGTVESANSVWISDDFSVRNRYVDLLQKDFGALVDNVDFSSPSTVREINNWCSEHTNGKITEIVDRLSPGMVMVLVNALYFNSPWKNAFNPELTHDDVFHGVNGDVKVPMMYGKIKCEYAEYMGFQLVGIPYSGGKYSMYIILPPSGMNLNEAVSYIDENIYDKAMGMLGLEEVSLTMPKFRLASSMVLNDALKRMGVESAFSPAADFGGISLSGQTMLDLVKQKCYIDVSEKGTEAAAVTGMQVRLTSLAPVTTMNVDRPFVFMIADRENENVLFVGKIVSL